MKTKHPKPSNKREDKKLVNIQWNSRLFFQIGIILSLLLVFFVMQTSFPVELSRNIDPESHGILEPAVIEYVIEVDKPEPSTPDIKEVSKPVQVPKKVISNTIEVAKNTNADIETSVKANTQMDAPVVPSQSAPSPTPKDTNDGSPKSVMNVEFVPVYPGCENLASNAEKINCMSSKINSFINKNFRREVLERLEPNRTHKIYVQFKIDTEGYIRDVRANSNNEQLKKEAQRVVGSLPEMKPGRQGDKNVDVLYTVPITFRIQ